MTCHELGMGPVHCGACRTQGSFEGVFYGLCDRCCINTDETERIKTFEFIQIIQKCIADTRLDHLTDEFEIVKDGIDAGFYILDLYIMGFYKRIMPIMKCCSECDTSVDITTLDHRNYCKECQNPEYDPVWPRGD